MKLANFKDIPPLERLFVDQLFGYLAGVPCYVALLDHHQRWVLYRIDMQAGKGGTRLTETKTVKSIKDVLSLGRNLEKSALVRHVEMKSIRAEFVY